MTTFNENRSASIVYPTTLAGEQRNPVLWLRRFFPLHPRYEFFLSVKGQALKPVLKALKDGGECYAGMRPGGRFDGPQRGHARPRQGPRNSKDKWSASRSSSLNQPNQSDVERS
jgi:hypothetical protein